MPLIADALAIPEHTGTTAVGPVEGTVEVVNQDFVRINGELVMVEGDTMEIPPHIFFFPPPPDPPLIHSHSFPVDTFQQDFVTIDGKKVVQVGDFYSPDPTTVILPGGNIFVTIN